MNTFEETKARTANAYNAASDLFDHPANTFWDRFGHSTVERLNLLPKEYVLDVCSGTGASALPAAMKVGSDGKVVAVDLADKLLNEAKIKAEVKNLKNIEFRVADMLALGYPDASFDAVVCIFGIFRSFPRAAWECSNGAPRCTSISHKAKVKRLYADFQALYGIHVIYAVHCCSTRRVETAFPRGAWERENKTY